MTPKNLVRIGAIACGLFALASSALAQGTAFTYQGRLLDNGNSINGTCDFSFGLYDSATNGIQQGNQVNISAVAVSNGLFTVTLDFGNEFPGTNRWLDISVRTNGNGTFTTLTPRQPLTPAPYAVTAENVTGSVQASQLSGAVPATNLTGTYNGPVSFNNGADSFNGTFTGQFFGSTFTGGAFNGEFFGDGGGLYNLNASQLSSGIVPLARLSGITSNQLDPATWQMLTNGNANSLGGLTATNFWQLGGNKVSTGQFLGSTNNQPVEFWVIALGHCGLNTPPTTASLTPATARTSSEDIRVTSHPMVFGVIAVILSAAAAMLPTSRRSWDRSTRS